jgi:hypothetical protein
MAVPGMPARAAAVLYRVEWCSDDGLFYSHDIPLRDAMVMAETMRWAGRRDAAVFEATR